MPRLSRDSKRHNVVALDLDRRELRRYVKESVSTYEARRRDIRAKLKLFFDLSSTPSGMTACLLYLKLFVGEAVTTEELAIVSGIATYARRLRELRVEYGYDLRVSHERGWTYTLARLEPSEEVAERWRTLNTIRKQGGSGRDRILQALLTFECQPLDIEALAYVSKIRTTRDRVRDLRLQEGWRIFGHHTGRPDLAVTEYVLESKERLPSHDRHIGDDVYESVLERDRYQCKKKGCGWSTDKRVQGSRRQFLEVHHRQTHARGGSNNAENLVTMCNLHHDHIHKSDLEGKALEAWLNAAM